MRDDPNNLLANEAMGMLVVLQCKCDEAAKWFGKAIDLGSENFVVLVGYGASALQNENTNNKDMDVKIETSLRKAIHINPGFAYSYDALALFYSKHNIKLDEAHILELQAIEINPQEVMFWLDNAQILVQQDRYKDAINGLKLGLEKVIEERVKLAFKSSWTSIRLRSTKRAIPHLRKLRSSS